jgi:hypothetical protein
MSTASAEPLRLAGRTLSVDGPLPWQSLTVIFLIAALAIGVIVPVPDVSWLLIVAERVLHGQQLYSQVLEVNPPLSVLLYMPPAFLADRLGIEPEVATAGLSVLAIACSIGLSAAILKPVMGGDPARGWKLVATAAFVLGVMPAAAFAQREQIAVMALLPFVATTMLRAGGRRPPWALAILAGVGLGLAVAIKPHFALMALLPWAWACWRSRSFRPWAEPELWTAVLAFGGYVAWFLVRYPIYFTRFVPVLRDVYLPVHAPLVLMLIMPGIPLALGAVAVARLMRLEWRWLSAPMLAALGGGVAYMAQGKSWPYHQYPMLAFAMLGLLGAAVLATPDRTRAWSWLDCRVWALPPLAAMAWLALDVNAGPLIRVVAAVAPPAPRMIALSGDFGLGIATTRGVHGRWVGGEHSEWITEGALWREEVGGLSPAERMRLEALKIAERGRLAQDIVAGRPDVMLIDRTPFDWRAWAAKDPAIAAELTHYRLRSVVQGTEILTRIPDQASLPRP